MNTTYCTVVYGEEYSEKYSDSINQYRDQVYVCTDSPTYFPFSPIIRYNKPYFSYYEKLMLTLNLVKETKNRVTYIDADSFEYLGDFLFKENVVYTNHIYRNTNYSREQLESEAGLKTLLSIYDEHSLEICDYIHERIFSIPYLENIEQIHNEVNNLREIFEDKHPEGKDWGNHPFSEFAKKGRGYGEGGAISAILNKHGVEIQELPVKTRIKEII